MNINDLIYVKCLIQCLAHSKNSILVGTIITILYHHVVYVISFPTWVSITFKYNLLCQLIEQVLVCLLDEKSDIIPWVLPWYPTSPLWIVQEPWHVLKPRERTGVWSVPFCHDFLLPRCVAVENGFCTAWTWPMPQRCPCEPALACLPSTPFSPSSALLCSELQGGRAGCSR